MLRLLGNEMTHRRVLLLVTVAALFIERPAAAQEMTPGFEATVSSGMAHFTTIQSALTVGADLGFRLGMVKIGGLAQYAVSPSGKATTLGGTAGVTFPFEVIDLDVLGIFGRHNYYDVGAVRASSSVDFGGCGDFTGVQGHSALLGLSVGVHSHDRKGPHVLWGVSAYYMRDLSTQHMDRTETVDCGFFATTHETRHAEADVGGNQFGVTLRFGLDVGGY